MLSEILQDIRFSFRQMRKAPAFAAVVVLTLSVGIGAAAAIFSVVDAVLLRPLPFVHAERLVYPFMKSRTGGSEPSSYLGYQDLRGQLRSFDALAGYSTMDSINLEGPSGPVMLRAVKGTDNFFSVFGVRPILGRTYVAGEDQPGKDNVAVLSYEVWQSNFGGDASVIGRTVQMDGNPYTVIGVMPSGFRYPLFMRNAVYTPLHAKADWKAARGFHWLKTVGVMKAGVSREQAEAEMNRGMANLARAYPQQEEGHTVSLHPLSVEVSMLQSGAMASGPLGTLSLACLALLGIACVNVAGLLLARGVKREREVALRAAIGANRARLVRQMFSESLVLCAAGTVGGVLLSWALLHAMNIYLVEALARGADIHLNVAAIMVALGLSLLTSVLASLGPAIRLSGTNPNRALRSGGAAGTAVSQHRLRAAFVVTQVALSLVLLVVSGLLIRKLENSLKVNPGFDPQKILAVRLSLSPGRYQARDPLTGFYKPLLEKVQSLPGVQAAGLIDLLPIAAWGDGYDIHITGQPPYPKNEPAAAETRIVSASYFDAMGIPLQSGRLLSPTLDKAENKAGTMVVNEAFRKRFFSGGGDPVGAHIDDADKPEEKSGIAGVVGSVRQDLQSAPMPEMDWLMDSIDAKARLGSLGSMFLVVRSAGDPSALIPAVTEAVHQIDPTVPVKDPMTMMQVIREQLVFERMEGWLFGIFAAFALLLAVVGLYGLVSHEVELRTREIGIRMALGSTRMLILGNVMRRLTMLMASGIAVGWVLTLASRRILRATVEMHPHQDATLLLMLTLGLAMAGVGAGILPARKAAAIEPMQALRSE